MHCASCQGQLTEVMDFGEVALAGAFLKPEDFATEQKHRLRLAFCETCCLVQIPDYVEPSTMFRDYFYFSSATATMRRHFKGLAQDIVARFKPRRVLEIGCNDGVLLKPLADLGVPVLTGVDPARNVVESIDDNRIDVIPEFFGPDVVPGVYDVVVANNVIAHVDDLHGVIRAVRNALSYENGVFIFEVNRLDSMVSDLQYDWIYHEHRFYYSLLALEHLLSQHGMMVFDLERIASHAGSIRYYACRTGKRTATAAVQRQRECDLWHGLNRIETFQRFAQRAYTHRVNLRERLTGHTRVAGYGACGRTNTLLQWCGLTTKHIAYIVDDAPAKQGFYTPGSHIPILPPSALKTSPPSLIVVFAWSFLSEIQPKLPDCEVMVPLPHIYTQQKKAA